jgi:HEAT repeat protein
MKRYFTSALALLLSLAQVVGVMEARSQTATAQLASPKADEAEISKFIQQLKDPDPKVRQVAATTLGEIGKSAKSAIPQLILLLKDSNEWVRISAAWAIEQLNAWGNQPSLK